MFTAIGKASHIFGKRQENSGKAASGCNLLTTLSSMYINGRLSGCTRAEDAIP